MEKVKQWLQKWLGWNVIHELNLERQLDISVLREEQARLLGRIEDLEAAYPDYKKAKAEADEKKANEIVPGFTPYTQRKRRWEAEHRKPAPKQKS